MSTQTETSSAWRPADTLASRLLLVRTALGLSQRAAALRTGVTFGQWQGMEDGRSSHKLIENLTKISEALGVDREWLTYGGLLGAGPTGSPTASTTQRLSPDSDAASPLWASATPVAA